MVTPVNVTAYQKLLDETAYDSKESRFLTDGFKFGFDLGYRGDTKVKRTAPNLKFNVGNHIVLWNKIMKEVKEGRFAGPYASIPYEYHIQSPVGLVPKDGGDGTRLIFHLSFPRSGKSVNSETPKELTTVHYCDFADAVRLCSKYGIGCVLGKSDMKSAFRNLGIKKSQWFLLIIMAKSPYDHEKYYFVDKALPFGSSVSCSLFQRFATSISHIVRVKCHGKENINYLDDYLFAEFVKSQCDAQIKVFLLVCKEINFPVSMEKTFWGTTVLVFLGLLLDTERQIVAILTEKVTRAIDLVTNILNSKKTTVHQLQKLCGFLNFLCRCIVPGRAFTRRIYTYYSPLMKPHHHVNVNRKIKEDLRMWIKFLSNPTIYCRPFIDFSMVLEAEQLDWYTDASGVVGVGGICQGNWFQMKWEKSFLRDYHPSIEFQELFGVAILVVLWLHKYENRRICLYCDNESVCFMLNKSSSDCMKCMALIRIITLKALQHNVRVFAQHLRTDQNYLADSLSRYQMNKFWEKVEEDELLVNYYPDDIPEVLLPPEKFYGVKTSINNI